MSKASRARQSRIKYGEVTDKPEPYSPTAQAYREYRFSKAPPRSLAHGTSGVSSRPSHVCVAKQFKFHPDAKLRALAEAQARDQHAFNDIIMHGQVCRGKCFAKACHRSTISTPMSMFQKNDHTMRIALGMKRQARIKERGW